MKMIAKIATITGVALLFVGCTQPDFNPANKALVFKNGKPYRVPYNTGYGNTIDNRNDLNYYTSKGARDCRIGDVVWINFDRNKRVTNDAEAGLAFAKAGKEGRLGCAHPLTQREYQFYLNQQNQQAANNRAQMNYDAQTAPRTHNVNYTGTVYHY